MKKRLVAGSPAIRVELSLSQRNQNQEYLNIMHNFLVYFVY